MRCERIFLPLVSRYIFQCYFFKYKLVKLLQRHKQRKYLSSEIKTEYFWLIVFLLKKNDIAERNG